MRRAAGTGIPSDRAGVNASEEFAWLGASESATIPPACNGDTLLSAKASQARTTPANRDTKTVLGFMVALHSCSAAASNMVWPSELYRVG